MIDKFLPRSNPQPTLIQTPEIPFPAREFFKQLRRQLESTHGRLTFDRLARMADLPKSTAHAWFEYFDLPQLVALMKWLERLPEETRYHLIDAHCRIYPTLDHPALAHAPTKVSQLWSLLEKPAGLTLITGGTDVRRSFVLTAMGHAASSVPQVTGIDLHFPDRFVPVAGMAYLHPQANPHQIVSAVVAAWPKLQRTKPCVFLGNRLWSQVPPIRQKLLGLAASTHVILADHQLPRLAEVKCWVRAPIHVVTVCATNRVAGGICLHCRHIKPLKCQ